MSLDWCAEESVSARGITSARIPGLSCAANRLYIGKCGQMVRYIQVKRSEKEEHP
jgi:hypothetical protein